MGLFGPPNIAKMSEKHDIKGLVKALSYEKEDQVRIAAVKALGSWREIESIDPLIRLLSDKNDKVRKAVLEALGKIGEPRVVETLVMFLKDSSSDVQQSAIDALCKIRHPIAVEALGKCGDARVVDPLKLILQDPRLEMHLAAEFALANIGSRYAINALLDEIKDKNTEVRSTVVEIINQHGGWMEEPWIFTRAINALLLALRDTREDIRKRVVVVLDKINWQPGNDDDAVYYWIIKGNRDKLVEIGAPAVIPLIEQLSRNRSDYATITALGDIGDERAVKPLANTLLQGGSDSIVINVLSKFQTPQAVDAIVSVLGYSSKEYDQKYAQAVLVKIGEPAVEPLITMLKVRHGSQIVETLAKIGDHRAAQPISAELTAKEPYKIKIVLDALEQFNWQPGNDEIGAYFWIHKGEWEKCTDIGSPAVRPLISKLQETSFEIRQQIARILVSLYKSGKLDRESKSLILAKRDVMIKSHNDAIGHSECTGIFHSDDGGIGIKFAL